MATTNPRDQLGAPLVLAHNDPKADKRWLDKAENWGEWVRYSSTEIAEPERVWMMKRGAKVRFYMVGKGQVGPQHAHVVAATCWAYGNGFLDADPANLGLSMACRAEVLRGGVDQELTVADLFTPLQWLQKAGVYVWEKSA